MKTSITIETTAEQEMMIHLWRTGDLGKANRKMVGEYFADITEMAKDRLSRDMAELKQSIEKLVPPDLSLPEQET